MEENQAPEEINTEKKNEDIQFVGERNAIVFSASAGEPVPPVELSDSFFDLNVDDVKLLFKEMKENREQMERMPFRTKAVREMEENAATLNRLNRYTQTVLRIQFPDRMVLQAVFNHSETIQTVMDFVRNFLDPSDIEFQLYTAPPKTILQPEVSLIDAKLTPRALVYLSAVPHQDKKSLLKETLLSSLTNPRLASEAALQYKRKEAQDVQPQKSATVSEETASTSRQSSTAASSAKSSKVPKWFKQ